VQIANCKLGIEMSIRKSIIAGSWYPGEAAKLKADVEKYLEAAKVILSSAKLLGIVVPHAGLMYSGPVAAFAYKNLKGLGIKTVVMVGPSHRASFEGSAIYASGEWETPLGKVWIDAELCQKIISQDKTHINDLPAAHAQEHSLEIQLPFLQTVLDPGFKIVPIMVSNHSLASCERLAHSIVQALNGGEGVLILAPCQLGMPCICCQWISARKMRCCKWQMGQGAGLYIIVMIPAPIQL